VSGAAGNGLTTTIKYLRGAASFGPLLGHHGAAGYGLGISTKYLRGAASFVWHRPGHYD
jgi:hypothetical protein